MRKQGEGIRIGSRSTADYMVILAEKTRAIHIKLEDGLTECGTKMNNKKQSNDVDNERMNVKIKEGSTEESNFSYV